MPLLALSGWLFGSSLAPKLDRVLEQWNRFGVAGFTLAIFTILFWMVPRSIDSAVAYPGYEMFKFVSQLQNSPVTIGIAAVRDSQ